MVINKNAVPVLSIYAIIAVLLCFYINDYNGEYTVELWFIFLSYIVVAIMYVQTITTMNEFDFFHPIHVVTFLYLCIFGITPILLVGAGREDCFGVDVMPGCIKATTIFLAGYIAYCVGYSVTSIRNTYPKIIEERKIFIETKRLLYVSIIIWCIGLIGDSLYQVSTGKSIFYVLSFGATGEFDFGSETYVNSELVRFLINFGYCMIIPLVVVFNISKSKILKMAMLFVTASVFYVHGFRIFLVIMLLGIILSYLRMNNKKLTTANLAILMLILLIMIGFLGFTRHSVRGGYSIDFNEFSFDDITYALESNFNIYQPFYGLVTKYPSTYNYTMGSSIFFDSIIMWIPRILWPGKPLATEQTMTIGLKRAVSDYAIDHAAMSWPNIAEYYMEFGVIGVIVIMYILGKVCKKSINLYHSSNFMSLVIYAVFLPTLIQLVIRGYTPSNITMIAFLFAPLLAYKIIGRFERK